MFPRYPDSSITMSSSFATASQQRHAQTLMEFKQEIFKRNVLTDVECVVEGQVFQAHRTLLACFSSYLKKKLVNKDGKPIGKKVYIPKVRSCEFEILLQYMYSGFLEVDCSNFFEVWSAASLLEMQKAQEELLKFFEEMDEIRIYFYTYILSKKLGFEPNRQQKALKLITHRFEETVFTQEFMQLDLQYVLEILSAQSIGARSETVVFLAALNWLDHDYGSRCIHAVSVMECVRFSCMSMEEIVACFHPPLLYHVVQLPEVLSMLFKGTCYIAAKSKGEERWFKQYTNIKRDLTLEKLPMKLWHKETSCPEDPERDSQRVDSSTMAKHEKFELPESLKDHIQTMFDNEDPERKHVEEFLNAKFKTSHPRFPGKEDSNIPAQPEDLLFRDRKDNFKDDELDKESISSDRADYPQKRKLYFKRSLAKIKENSSFFSRKEESDIHRIPPIKPESIAGETPEIQRIVPENAEIKYLVKEPLKYEDEKTESPYTLEKYPEKQIEVLEDKDFERTGDNKKEPKVSQSIIFSDRSIKESGCILVIGGMDPNDFRKDSGGNVLIFNVQLNKWLPYTDLPEPRHNHSSACIGNTLYVIGGCNSKETIEQNRHVPKSSCYKLNLEKTKWSMMPNMTSARFDHAMVVYKGSLIVIGGQDEKGRLLKSVEMYDPKQKRWKLLSNMCCGRKAMGATVFADRIWIAGGVIPSSGGQSQMEVVTHVDLFNPNENKWYFNSYSLPSARSHCCLIKWGEKLYCIGGMVQVEKGKQCATDEVWFVEGENQLWKPGPYLPEPRMGGIVVIYGNNLYYVGGYDPENRSNIQNVIYLTPGATSWNIGPPMIYGMFGLSAVSFRIIEEK